jgi:hypothetical protein
MLRQHHAGMGGRNRGIVHRTQQGTSVCHGFPEFGDMGWPLSILSPQKKTPAAGAAGAKRFK